MVRSALVYLLFTLVAVYETQPSVKWIQNNDQDLGIRSFETLLSRLFRITQNFYVNDDSTSTEEQMKDREHYNAKASEVKGLLERIISYLHDDERRTDERNFNKEFRKRRPTFYKGTFTIEQHVCVREKKLPLLYEASESTCASYKRAMRCITGDGNRTLMRIIECCDGYYTTDIEKGCIPYDAPKDLDELLYGKNACTKALESKDTKFTTLLIPSNESCPANDTDNRNWDEYILEERYRSYEMLNSQKLPTRKPGTFVIVSTNAEPTDLDNKPLLNCIKIINEDLEWRNGTVQLLSAPLPQATSQTLLDIIIMLTDDLQERLASNSLISTVFVFNNETFESLSPPFPIRLRQKKGCVKELIKEHVYDGMLCSSALKEGEIKSVTGIKHRLYKLQNENTELIRLDNGRILDTDRVSSNGVIHIIDDIILAEQAIVDWHNLLMFPEREFLKIVERNIAYEDDPVAIFIPPGNSFRNLTDEKSFVMNHIAINYSHITNELIETAYGSKIPSLMKSPLPVFGCSNTIKPPIKYCSTTIYSIDAPLPRTMNTLKELISSRDDFSVFASLLNESNVNLDNKRPYTVFLPSNDALSNNQIRTLKTNKTLANDFVRRHIFVGLLCSKNFQARTSDGEIPIVLENFRSEYYYDRSADKKTTLDDIDLQDMDIFAVNGILHVLKSPLKSQTSSKHHILCSIFDFI